MQFNPSPLLNFTMTIETILSRSKQQATSSKQHSRQQAAGSRQQAAGNKQQAAGSKRALTCKQEASES